MVTLERALSSETQSAQYAPVRVRPEASCFTVIQNDYVADDPYFSPLRRDSK